MVIKKVIQFISCILLISCANKNSLYVSQYSSDYFESFATLEIEANFMYIKINNHILEATLEDNSSTKALIDKLKENDIVINMHDYASFEKVGDLGFSLPRNDKYHEVDAGDLILYLGNNFSIYYDKNAYNFTLLGHINNVDKKELKNILGKDDVEVLLSLTM